jgi:hypothetical protein
MLIVQISWPACLQRRTGLVIKRLGAYIGKMSRSSKNFFAWKLNFLTPPYVLISGTEPISGWSIGCGPY